MKFKINDRVVPLLKLFDPADPFHNLIRSRIDPDQVYVVSEVNDKHGYIKLFGHADIAFASEAWRHEKQEGFTLDEI